MDNDLKECDMFWKEYEKFWKYFEFHATQRLVTFRYFIIIEALILSGFIALSAKAAFSTCNEQSTLLLFCINFGIGMALALFSILFWILDKRNYMMIDISRDELINMEKDEKNDKLLKYKLFLEVQDRTKKCNCFTFRFCFNSIFLIFICIGILIAIYSFYQICQ